MINLSLLHVAVKPLHDFYADINQIFLYHPYIHLQVNSMAWCIICTYKRATAVRESVGILNNISLV